MPQVTVFLTAIVAITAGFFLQTFNTSEPEPTNPATAFALPTSDGNPANLAKWSGQWRLINFWAEWCPPCKKEIPLLIEWQTAHSSDTVTVIGVSLDELDVAQRNIAEMGINYPNLVHSFDAITLGNLLGNEAGALPYTVLMTPDDQIVYTKMGELTNKEMQEITQKVFDRP